MKYFALISLALGLPLLAVPVQAADIMTILAQKGQTPARLAPETIDYTYTLTVDVKNREGKDLSEGQAVLRIDPTQPPGFRAQIISASDEESEALQDFLKQIEDPENTLDKQAEGFWCGSSDKKTQTDFNPENFTVIFEDDTQAILRPELTKLAELLMQSDENDQMKKQERKMMERLMDRIDGEVTLAKPSAEMTGFKVRMTRPMTMMLVAKLKVMDVEQSCELAPNGHYRIGTMKLNVEGKALGSRFGQALDMRISDLTPIQ